MKKYVLTGLIGILAFRISFAQTEALVKEMIEEGIKLHERGEYNGAIQKYQEALLIDPGSSRANYEIAFSYYQMNKIEEAIPFVHKALGKDSEAYLPAAILYGNILDESGESKKALKYYKKTLKSYPNDYLLNYNIALTYYNDHEYEKAENHLKTAISDNVLHTSSHLMLGYVKNIQGDRVRSLLSLYFFLLLEPNTLRSRDAYQLLTSQQNQGVERAGDKDINIEISTYTKKDDLNVADLMISMKASSRHLEKNQGKSDMLLFSENNEALFKILGELKDGNKGFWWDLYVPFFYELALAGYTETFSYYISQGQASVAENWLGKNEDKLDTFIAWLNDE